MIKLSNIEYLNKFYQTNSELPAFKRHLDACGINAKMSMERRSKKFLWGVRTAGSPYWMSLDSLSYSHLANIKTYLSNYLHSFDDAQIGWVLDLVDYNLKYKTTK